MESVPEMVGDGHQTKWSQVDRTNIPTGVLKRCLWTDVHWSICVLFKRSRKSKSKVL
jgi:hypothetical protein